MPISSDQQLRTLDSAKLSANYAKKGSKQRYNELKAVFPNTLILFKHDGNYYGYEETAVFLSGLLGIEQYIKNEMLIVRIESIGLFNGDAMQGYRYIVDENGKLTFVSGKEFCLNSPLRHKKNPKRILLSSNKNSTPKTSSLTNAYSKRGGDWLDNVWVPGLPSSRLYRKRRGH